MREILFRGKRIDSGEWVEGSLLKVTLNGETVYLIFGDNFSFDGTDVKALSHALVDPDTVGQYTGLTDKNGKLIFEGDILRYEYGGVCSVEYGHFNCSCCHGVFGWSITQDGDIRDYKYHKVIGNIHDNPELLGGNSP